MKIIEIKDRFNKNKIWIIKKYKSSNYYINQKIFKKIFYRKFQRSTKKKINNILGGGFNG
jgi:hypothetical protein